MAQSNTQPVVLLVEDDRDWQDIWNKSIPRLISGTACNFSAEILQAFR
jgi:hypothetical protein